MDDKMEYIQIVNWATFQHYKDRNPPWIKLHTEILTDYNFYCLQDDSKLLLILLGLLASKLDNKIPDDPEWIKEQIHVGKVDLQPLYDKGFIELVGPDSIAIAKCLQDAIPEAETEKRQRREEKSSILFNQFWTEYPRKDAKQRAVAWFEKNKPTEDDVYKMLYTIAFQKKQSGGRLNCERKFMPLPETWLNDGDWQDAPSKAEQEQARAEKAAANARREAQADAATKQIQEADAKRLKEKETEIRKEEGPKYEAMPTEQLQKIIDTHVPFKIFITRGWLIKEILEARQPA